MFNKKVTFESLERQEIMFEKLMKVFCGEGCDVTEKPSQSGNKIHYVATGYGFTVVSKPTRHECVVKWGNSSIFEVFIDLKSGYDIFTTGNVLRHVLFDKECYDIVKNSYTYNPKFDKKCGFSVPEELFVTICESFMRVDEEFDNHLVEEEPNEVHKFVVNVSATR